MIMIMTLIMMIIVRLLGTYLNGEEGEKLPVLIRNLLFALLFLFVPVFFFCFLFFVFFFGNTLWFNVVVIHFLLVIKEVGANTIQLYQ